MTESEFRADNRKQDKEQLEDGEAHGAQLLH